MAKNTEKQILSISSIMWFVLVAFVVHMSVNPIVIYIPTIDLYIAEIFNLWGILILTAFLSDASRYIKCLHIVGLSRCFIMLHQYY